jgi:acetylglutamate kinase
MEAADISPEVKTEVLLEALPYIQTFKESIFVVKFGGSFMDTEQARIGVAMDLVLLATVGIRVIVVHGGGPAINRAMKEAAIEPVWKDGLRYTDSACIEIVERTLNGVINPQICENLKGQKGKSCGLRGQDVFRCVPMDCDSQGKALDLGFVGRIEDVETKELDGILEKGQIPVISPLALGSGGQVYNVNADMAAAELAAAVGARRLVYLCDVPGLLRDPADVDSLISSVSRSEVAPLREAGIIGSGMLPKVESATGALERGVRRVHLIDGRLAHSILLEIFTDRGVGTEIVQSPKGE